MTTITFGKPVTSDDRAAVLQYIRDYMDGQAKMFNGDTLVSLPTGTIRYVTANNRFEKWSGTAWESLNITGNVTPTPPGGSTTHVQFNDGGGNFGGDADLTWDKTANQLAITGSARVNSSVLDYFMADGLGGFSMAAKLAVGGWARGIVVVKNSDASRLGGAGFSGNNEDALSEFRVGFGSDWWNEGATYGFAVYPDKRAALGQVTPTIWNTAYQNFEMGYAGTSLATAVGASQAIIVCNGYYDSTPAWRHKNTGAMLQFNVSPSNGIEFTYKGSQAAGTIVSAWDSTLTWDTGGMISLKGSGAGVYHFSRDGDGQAWLTYSPDGEVFAIYNNAGGSVVEFGKTTHVSYKRFQIRRDSPTAYNDGQLELYSGAGDVLLGFHAGGANAGSIGWSRSSARFKFWGNPISGYADVEMRNLYGTGNTSSAYGALLVVGSKAGYGGIGFYDDGGYCGQWMTDSGSTIYGWYSYTDNRWEQYQYQNTGDWVSRGNVTAYSDRRHKTNIKTLKDSLSKVRRMRGVSYDRTDDAPPGIGVIAQEMREVEPRVVIEGEGTILSVAYGNLAGYFIEAIKELAERLERMEFAHENR